LTFTTLTFLLFLPTVFALHWASPRQRWRNLVLVVASYFFYGWWDARFALLMAVASTVDFLAGIALERTEAPRWRRLILLGSCTCSLGLLGFFKYFGFFAENARALAASMGLTLTPFELRVVLPVGISFYTFQTLSYVIDVYRRDLRATHDVVEYMAYVSFFPQLVAGPIERAPHLLPQFQSARVFDRDEAREGLRFMAWGFFKKLVLADNLGTVGDAAFRDVAAADAPTLALATVAFAFQIYCDFSAYSDIAVGCGRLFGIRLMRNFAYPYFSQGVAEFWRRWHISLSTWFRDYVYVPLGGGRVGPLTRARNVIVTFLLSGLWHGASWNFVVWGLLNGLAVLPAALSRGTGRGPYPEVPGGDGRLPSPAAAARIAATFLFTCVAWVFFRAPTLSDAGLVLARLATGPWSLPAVLAAVAEVRLLFAALAVFVAIEWTARRHWHPLQWPALPRPLRWAGYSVLVWLTLALSREQGGAFIYFQF
jgi:D-alanyl-lipoteichoic acid acyltransferase DltB (MBOAT superfamily)